MAMTFEQYRDLRKKGYSQTQLQNLNQENKPKSFFSKLGDALKSRASNAQGDAQKLVTGQISGTESKLRMAGQVAGAVSDVAGIALGSAAKTVYNALPQQGQANLKDIGNGVMQSRPGKATMRGIQSGMEAYGSFKESNPRLATNLEAVGNIASAIPVGFGGKVVAKEGVNIAKDAANIAKRVGTSNIDEVIETGISKGIRPSVVGKNSLAQLDQYKTKAKEAVLNIVKNKQNLSYVDEFGESVTGKLPSSLKELTEAVDQTKKRIFSEYSALASKAGGTGVAVDLNKVTSELGKIVNDKVIQTISPETAQYATNLIERFSKQGSFTPEQAQQAIANMNSSLEAFYKNPTYGTYRQAQIDALITNNLRESLDEVITSATGPGYAALKKAYGSLKTIEKDAIKRAVVEGRKNAKGLVDFTDIFSAGDVVMGVATGNPAQVAKGAIQKAVSSYIKRLNSPDNAIKQMFKKVDGAIEKGKSTSAPFVPKSMTGKGIQSMKGKGGLSIQAVGREYSSGSKKTAEAISKSTGQEEVSTGFELGSFGRNQIESKIDKADRFSASELSDTIKNIKNTFRASDDKTNYRYDNVAHIAEMPNGEKRAIYTRLNNNGKEEIINWHKVDEIKNPNYLKQLESFGSPDGNRTHILDLEGQRSNPLAYGAKSSIAQNDSKVNRRGFGTGAGRGGEDKTALLTDSKKKLSNFLKGLKTDKMNESDAAEFIKETEKNLKPNLSAERIKSYVEDAQFEIDKVLKERGKSFIKGERVKNLIQSAEKATDYASWIKKEGLKASETMKQLYLDAKRKLKK